MDVPTLTYHRDLDVGEDGGRRGGALQAHWWNQPLKKLVAAPHSPTLRSCCVLVLGADFRRGRTTSLEPGVSGIEDNNRAYKSSLPRHNIIRNLSHCHSTFNTFFTGTNT